MHHSFALALLVLLGYSLAAPLRADVPRASASDFTVTHVIDVGTSPSTAWNAIVDVGSWWSSAHTYSGDARNLKLDARAGGCFCETLAANGSVQHMQVIHARPLHTLRLAGALGPLQQYALVGTLTFTIEATADGSTIALTYAVSGSADRALSEWAPPVDTMLGEQIQRLAQYIATGKPTQENSRP